MYSCRDGNLRSVNIDSEPKVVRQLVSNSKCRLVFVNLLKKIFKLPVFVKPDQIIVLHFRFRHGSVLSGKRGRGSNWAMGIYLDTVFKFIWSSDLYICLNCLYFSLCNTLLQDTMEWVATLRITWWNKVWTRSEKKLKGRNCKVCIRRMFAVNFSFTLFCLKVYE